MMKQYICRKSDINNRFELVKGSDNKKWIIDRDDGEMMPNGFVTVYQKLSTEEIVSHLNDLQDTVTQLENEVARKEMTIGKLDEKNAKLVQRMKDTLALVRMIGSDCVQSSEDIKKFIEENKVNYDCG